MHIRKIVFVMLGISAVGGTLCAQLTPVAAVPGKEYSNNRDIDMGHAPDSMQNLEWDGLGANIDAFDYSGSSPSTSPDLGEVDALSNNTDAFLNELVASTAGMVLSLESENFVRYHDVSGGVGIWATADQVRSSAPGVDNADDVDALEIWGPIDANHYSILGDPATPPDTSVYYYDSTAHASTTYIAHSTLLAEVNRFLGMDLQEIDVDALMVNDLTTVGDWEGNDEVLFSLRPVLDPTGALALDGGEIFHWINGVGMSFLVHGGVKWDTANDVMGLFGSASENINALEAVSMEETIPEPSLLLPVGLFFVFMTLLRRKRP